MGTARTVLLAALVLCLGGCLSGPSGDDSTGASTNAPTVCMALFVRPCSCPDGTSSTETCNAQGTAFDACNCAQRTSQLCAPNALQSCLCTDGSSGVERCDAMGTSWGACTCETLPPEPCVATQPQSYQGCSGQNIVWYDDCDQPGATVQSCTGGAVCVDGQCVTDCEPEAGLYCLFDAITWYDSCNQPGFQTEICSPDKFCEGCTIDQKPCTSPPVCTSASFDGSWELVANPATLDNCSLPKTYPGNQFLVVSTNGNAATGVIDNALAYGPPVNFTGTVNGKYLSMEASYAEDAPPSVGFAVEHDHVIDVSITSGTTFAGTHAHTYTQNVGTTCTWLWTITGALH